MRTLSREYPNINGFPVSPHELELPLTKLDPAKQETWNNHHACFTARKMGLFLITQTWRDLSTNQYAMPKDTHAILHDRYEPARLPELVDIMDELEQAKEGGIPLRYGSANHPTNNLINQQLWRAITSEYTELSR